MEVPNTIFDSNDIGGDKKSAPINNETNRKKMPVRESWEPLLKFTYGRYSDDTEEDREALNIVIDDILDAVHEETVDLLEESIDYETLGDKIRAILINGGEY